MAKILLTVLYPVTKLNLKAYYVKRPLLFLAHTKKYYKRFRDTCITKELFQAYILVKKFFNYLYYSLSLI